MSILPSRNLVKLFFGASLVFFLSFSFVSAQEVSTTDPDIQDNRPAVGIPVEFTVSIPACIDALDNDSDSLTDYPNDPGCSSPADEDEYQAPPPVTAPVSVPAPDLPPPPSPVPVVQTVEKTVAKVVASKPYQFVEKKVIRNPRVQTVNKTVAAPVIVVAAAANTVTAVASTGVSLASIFTYLQGLLTQPLLLFVGRRRKDWGLVYSSLTKLPVDLALVRLIESGTKRLIQTRVTDKQGRYLFLADQGTYEIEVQKSGFTFPSSYLKNKTQDLDLIDLYHGGPVTVTAKSTSLTYPIPLDPKERTETPAQVLSLRRKRTLQQGLAYAGPVFALISVTLTPTLTTTALLVIQFLFLGLFRRLATRGKPPHSWGEVSDDTDGQPLSYAVARIFESHFNKLLETQITDKLGRYAFLVGRGTFYMTIDKPGYLPYKSELIDLSRVEHQELVKRGVRLRRGVVSDGTRSLS